MNSARVVVPNTNGRNPYVFYEYADMRIGVLMLDDMLSCNISIKDLS